MVNSPSVPPENLPQILPRIMLAAPASGQGKTTLSVGLLAALRARGLVVAPFKVGPDYIDPGFHSVAAGRPGRNLDPHLCGEQRIGPLLAHGARDADVAVIEGVMGLFDGRLGTNGFGSSAHVARLTGTPVLLVIDAGSSSRTVAAVALGLSRFDPGVRIAGVLLNRAAGAEHVRDMRAAIAGEVGVPVVGAIPTTAALSVPERHLGLVPAAELDAARAAVNACGAVVAEHVDLDLVLALAGSAPPLDAVPWDPAAEVVPVPGRPVVAVATGAAFTFRYAEHDELLRAAGCQVVPVDPLTDTALPPGTAGLFLGGGFPEVFADRLSANRALMADVAAAIDAGLPTVAECAGLLYLGRSLDGVPMAGALPVESTMASRLTLGYHHAVAVGDSVVTRAGESIAAHEFHVSSATPAGHAWNIDGRPEGFATASLLASYQHVHWAGQPQFAQRLAQAASDFAASGRRWVAEVSQLAERVDPAHQDDHHGDRDALPGLVDLAVNVRRTPPAWLVQRLTADPDRWARYPDATAAREAICAAHGVSLESVLPCAGGMSAFTLIARALGLRSPVVVHPQFSGPDAALRAAGIAPRHVVLLASDGFRLDAGVVGTGDAVFVGNPTNPTSVLHPRGVLEALRQPGRVLVVDEAFLDAVPGEPESMLTGDLTGVLVLRSLTKTWGLAGIRAGYVVGDQRLIARLAAQQAPWEVSTPALDALVSCLSDAARAQGAADAEQMVAARDLLVAELTAVGVPVVPEPRGPFVLADTGDPRARAGLVDAGFAVRRGDTFPGLGPTWLRLAVRDPDTSRQVAGVLREMLYHKEK